MGKNFSFGDITPGKLIDITDIKILICYILLGVKTSLSKESIIEVLCGEDLADYFDASVAVAELVEMGQLYEEENGEVRLTIKGKNAASELESRLSLTVREKAMTQALKLLARSKSEAENEVKIEKNGDAWQITFCISDGMDDMLNLKLYVSDEMQAEKLKESFLENPSKLYTSVMDALLK